MLKELQFSMGDNKLRTILKKKKKNRINTKTRGCLNVTEVGRRSRRNMCYVIIGTLENDSEKG